MAKSFRVRKISYQWITLIVVLALAIVWICLDRKLLGVVRIAGSVGVDIRPNADPYPNQRQRGCMDPPGFTGVARFHGISKLIYRKKAWKSQQIVLRHTKGHVTLDPKDRKAFIASMKEANPMMEYAEE